MRYLRFLRPGALALVALLASCGNSDTEVTAYYVRAVHVMKDAPSLQLNIGELPLHTGISYLQATGYGIPVTGGQAVHTTNADLIAHTAAGDPISLASSENFGFEAAREYTMTAAGSMAEPVLFVTSNPRRQKPVTGAYLEFIHASVDTGALDVFLTAPGEDLAGVTPFATLALGESTGSLQIVQGTYQIRITEAGFSTVIFESSEVILQSDAEWQMTIADNLKSGDSPLRLVSAANSAFGAIHDVSVTPMVRTIMIDADQGAIDVRAGSDQEVIASAIAYGESSVYAPVGAGSQDVVTTVAGDPATVLYESTEVVIQGDEYTYLVRTEPEGQVSALLFFDDRRPIALGAKIRSVNATSGSELYDVYLTPEMPTGSRPEPKYGINWSLDYGRIGAAFLVEPGEYYLTVVTKEAGLDVYLLDPMLVQFNGGESLTLLIGRTSPTDAAPLIRFLDDSLY